LYTATRGDDSACPRLMNEASDVVQVLPIDNGKRVDPGRFNDMIPNYFWRGMFLFSVFLDSGRRFNRGFARGWDFFQHMHREKVMIFNHGERVKLV